MQVNPHWLAEGCKAHGLALFFKDVAKKLPWAKEVVDAALVISGGLSGSEKLRHALLNAQEALYGKARFITTHCESRWAIHLFIASDCYSSKDALVRVSRKLGGHGGHGGHEVLLRCIATVTYGWFPSPWCRGESPSPLLVCCLI